VSFYPEEKCKDTLSLLTSLSYIKEQGFATPKASAKERNNSSVLKGVVHIWKSEQGSRQEKKKLSNIDHPHTRLGEVTMKSRWGGRGCYWHPLYSHVRSQKAALSVVKVRKHTGLNFDLTER
jgi:hypothetical protein